MFLVLRAECASSRILNASTALRLRHLDRPSVYASRGYSFSTPPTNDGNLETVTPGTAPPCGAYLVLHTTTPSSEWPSHPPLYSPLMRELILKLKPMKFVLNLSYDPNAPGRLPQSDAEKLEEVYSATLYRPMNPPIRIPSLSLRYIDDIDVHLDNSESLDPNIEGILVSGGREIYVCTHNSRDCRCGTVGLSVFQRLADLSSKTTSSSSPSSSMQSIPVNVSQICHVGKHAFSANVLDFPTGDWYGSVLPSNVDAFYNALVSSPLPLGAQSSRGHSTRTRQDERLLANLWRGRMGMNREDQLAYHTELIARLDSQTRENSAASASASPARHPGSSSITADPSNTKKITLVFETFDGAELSISASIGKSVMEVAKEAGMPSIEGTCGGKLECATCHLYIVDSPVSQGSLPLAPPSEAEEDMLEYALFRADNSRLSCQVKVTEDLGRWSEAGGKLKLPKY